MIIESKNLACTRELEIHISTDRVRPDDYHISTVVLLTEILQDSRCSNLSTMEDGGVGHRTNLEILILRHTASISHELSTVVWTPEAQIVL
jgi:hypothetical protein